MSLTIRSLGSGLAFQDAGRTGWRRYGVPPGGAMDRHAMRVANELLGNRGEAPVLEILMHGAKLMLSEDLWLACAGADSCPDLPAWTAQELKAGTVLEFSVKTQGLFTYLAVPGGFSAPRWFDSVSVDLRNGLGSALQAGDVLQSTLHLPGISMNQIKRRLAVPEDRRIYAATEHFSLLPGPQFDDFSGYAREQLVTAGWAVSSRIDRTGCRLSGPTLSVPDSIPSEPVLPGSFQVPGNGQPIVTMVDGPTVGGYPKIAVLKDADRDRLAQCVPGTLIQFQWA